MTTNALQDYIIPEPNSTGGIGQTLYSARNRPLDCNRILRRRQDTPTQQLKSYGNEMRRESTNAAVDSKLG